jgi:16S rRNA processing protein RimM
MGRVLGPFGVRGWVKIHPYTEHPAGLTQYAQWWLRTPKGWQAFSPAETEQHGQHLVARLQGLSDRDEASGFTGVDIAVDREVLPETDSGEYYKDDLVGLKVVNLAGENLGRVVEVFENGAHDILRVVDAGVERLLPFIGNVVEKVDIGAGEIQVDWGVDW